VDDYIPGLQSDTIMSPAGHAHIRHDLGITRVLEPEGVMTRRDLSEPEDGSQLAEGDDDMADSNNEALRSTRSSETGESSRGDRSMALDAALRGKQREHASLSGTATSEGQDLWDLVDNASRWVEDSGIAGMGQEYSHTRIVPLSPSSYLRPGSRFRGTQQSERQKYEVHVDIKYIDLAESFLCGYLRIQGLTDDHPTLTTYFEGEIVGPKHGFITEHPAWGASKEVDVTHWGQFGPFHHYRKRIEKGSQAWIKDPARQRHIFMRWKEHFLVPDHRVRTINGASFEGFYYICFDQVNGEIDGIYFHCKSEKFQKLKLQHIPDKGCFGAMEFR